MTAIEADKQIEKIRRLSREMKRDPELAKRLLQRTGIYTPSGQLKAQYR